MTNSNLWTYRDTLDTSRDMVGYNVEATDGSIGKIDEASTETSRRYLVVDTGFWIFGKKRLIPAGAPPSCRSRRPQGLCLDDQGPDQERA